MSVLITAGGVAATCAVLMVLGKLVYMGICAARDWVISTLDMALLRFKAELLNELDSRYMRPRAANGD